MSRFELHRFSSPSLVLAGLCLLGAGLAHAQPVARQAALADVGRTATPAEIKAWDIDVRPDFKGLPKGKGSVRQGEVLWEAQCASCHGSFAESSEIFTPIAGGITAQDIKNGRVDGLMPGANQPNRTTLMKVATVSTLWDYINRAMPWNAPKTLTADEVYAVTAYILNLGNVLPDDYTLSDANIREVQARLPNRNGMTTAHAMWPGKELGGAAKPDVQGSNCMANCKTEVVVKSFLPDYARNAHGNLAEQSRLVGASRGVDTTQPPMAAGSPSNSAPAQVGRAQAAPEKIATSASAAATPASSTAKPAAAGAASVMPLLQKNACLACHGMDNKLVGPSFKDIANKYKDRADAANYLSGKIKSGGQGVWGAIPMPPQALSAAEAGQVSQWLLQGAVK
ncbi:sulfur dehydrogenase subunit SoxD [Polaromonas sp. YR568]|uniref:c-type cytochrome n=1 Tax=Polaromonas sp. YR568 TaxID=1855301 RepID=UPI0008DF1FBF|nr:c-type cytochrome [Polaromonas sp. YR568]SFU28900.1 sulfur dehydrogenase subunit SoxD [Polaromonas sp. YR568]